MFVASQSDVQRANNKRRHQRKQKKGDKKRIGVRHGVGIPISTTTTTTTMTSSSLAGSFIHSPSVLRSFRFLSLLSRLSLFFLHFFLSLHSDSIGLPLGPIDRPIQLKSDVMASPPTVPFLFPFFLALSLSLSLSLFLSTCSLPSVSVSLLIIISNYRGETQDKTAESSFKKTDSIEYNQTSTTKKNNNNKKQNKTKETRLTCEPKIQSAATTMHSNALKTKWEQLGKRNTVT